jgi:hypothetical protein
VQRHCRLAKMARKNAAHATSREITPPAVCGWSEMVDAQLRRWLVLIFRLDPAFDLTLEALGLVNGQLTTVTAATPTLTGRHMGAGRCLMG